MFHFIIFRVWYGSPIVLIDESSKCIAYIDINCIYDSPCVYISCLGSKLFRAFWFSVAHVVQNKSYCI